MTLDPKRFEVERRAEHMARAEGFAWDVLTAAEMCVNLFRLKAEATLRAEQKQTIKGQLRERLSHLKDSGKTCLSDDVATDKASPNFYSETEMRTDS